MNGTRNIYTIVGYENQRYKLKNNEIGEEQTNVYNCLFTTELEKPIEPKLLQLALDLLQLESREDLSPEQEKLLANYDTETN